MALASSKPIPMVTPIAKRQPITAFPNMVFKSIIAVTSFHKTTLIPPVTSITKPQFSI